MKFLFTHGGLDWIAILLTLTSLYRLGNKRRDGFLFGMSANVAWGAFGFAVASAATVLANVVFLCMNVRGFVRWGCATSPGLNKR